MRFKFFYGGTPHYTDADRASFSHDGYECKALMADRQGAPVVISRSTDPGWPVWKVAYGFSFVFFGTYADAMAFCKSRFRQ